MFNSKNAALRPGVVVSVLLLMAWSVATATARDATEMIPADARVCVGWDRITPADDKCNRWIRSTLENLFTRIAEDQGPDEIEPVRRLSRLLTEAASASGAAALLDISVVNGVPVPELVLAVSELKDAAAVVKTVDELLAADGLMSETVMIGGAALRMVSPADAPAPFFFGEHRGVFVGALGENAATKLLAVVKGGGESLSRDAELQADRKRVERYRNVENLFAYVRLPLLIDSIRKATTEAGEPPPPNVDEILRELGLAAMQSLYWSHGSDARSMAGALFLHTDAGADRGLLRVFRQAGDARSLLKLVPQDVYWASASTLDLTGLWQEVVRVAESLAPDQAPQLQSSVGMARQMLGFSPTDDLLPNLGRQWLFFDAPDHGGLLFTGAVLVTKPKDAAGLDEMVGRIGEMLTPLLVMAKSQLKQETTTYDGCTLHSWIVAGLPVPIIPSWCTVDGRTIFALSPQTLAVACKRMRAQSKEASLTDHAELSKALDAWPAELTSVCYTDTRTCMRMIYPLWNLIQCAASSFNARYGGGIDLEMFSPLPEAIKDIRCAARGTWHEPDGLFLAYSGTGGIAGQLSTVPVAFATSMTASILLPSLARARELAKRTVSSSNLRGLGMGCHIYANDHDSAFPTDLGQLVQQGVATAKMLHSPRDRGPDSETSYVYISGQKQSSDVRNVLAYEKVLGDEGTNVLFVDGHVEWMDVASFAAALRSTYERLNRMDELPPEYRAAPVAEDEDGEE